MLGDNLVILESHLQSSQTLSNFGALRSPMSPIPALETNMPRSRPLPPSIRRDVSASAFAHQDGTPLVADRRAGYVAWCLTPLRPGISQ